MHGKLMRTSLYAAVCGSVGVHVRTILRPCRTAARQHEGPTGPKGLSCSLPGQRRGFTVAPEGPRAVAAAA